MWKIDYSPFSKGEYTNTALFAIVRDVPNDTQEHCLYCIEFGASVVGPSGQTKPNDLGFICHSSPILRHQIGVIHANVIREHLAKNFCVFLTVC